MTLRERIVNALLRLYPATWRMEYGTELAELLRRRPLDAGVIWDVFWNGLRARILVQLPAAVIGLGMTGVVIAAYMTGARILEPTDITLPSLVVAQTNPRGALYVLVLVSCGVWTRLRRGGSIGRSARAAALVTLIADFPVLVVGLATVSAGVVAAPLLALPYSAVWGAVGGQVGIWIASACKFARVARPPRSSGTHSGSDNARTTAPTTHETR
jgi:hypothetical protein